MARYSVELSPGDEALLEMLAGGSKDRQIAAAFGWHRESVTRKVGKVMDKLGALTRCEAVAIYERTIRKP
ncbi:MAG TPA: LuxR C-terminal-related transcriptional regulator [Kofleriaceae bacterium]